MVTCGILAILDHSALLPVAHLSFNLGQKRVVNDSNLVRRCMACNVGRYIRFTQDQMSSLWIEERLHNHSDKASSPSKQSMSRCLSVVKCCISFGRESTLGHPCNNNVSRDVCKYWMELSLRLGNTSNSSQNPLIFKYFKLVKHANSSGKHANFNVWQLKMDRWVIQFSKIWN